MKIECVKCSLFKCLSTTFVANCLLYMFEDTGRFEPIAKLGKPFESQVTCEGICH